MNQSQFLVYYSVAVQTPFPKSNLAGFRGRNFPYALLSLETASILGCSFPEKGKLFPAVE